MQHRGKLVAAVAAVALLAPATAGAQQNYPAPGDPGQSPGKARGKGGTLTVCKRGCDYRTIQRAVNAATGRNTIRVRRGTYREGVQISGSRYDGLKLIGDARRPKRVKLDGKGLRGAAAQNGVLVNNADGVVVRGFYARHYKANCFFATNLSDYVLDRLVAERCGAYGVYAFNSKGGRMTNSEAYYNNDSGFYVGQTPPQRGRKKRTLVRNVDSWGNVLGFSGSNMRYTTITRSRWYNNGAGIVPNTLDSEKFPPAEENVIAGNDVFWNNFNFYWKAPFEIPERSATSIPYPIGVGILLFGTRNTVVEDNRISGHYLGGFAATPAVQLSASEDPALREASVLRNNSVRDNDFGAGNDLNNRDMVYDGSGTGNCFADNTLRSTNLPESNATFAPCPGPAQNAEDPAVLVTALSWVVAGDPSQPASFEAFWVKHPHPARRGVKPLERYTGKALAATTASTAGPAKRTVRVLDYYLTPERLSVPRGSTITWRWPSAPGDLHDIYSQSRPKGVKRFKSRLAASDYRYRRTLTKPGRYVVICTLHPQMRQTIRVRR